MGFPRNPIPGAENADESYRVGAPLTSSRGPRRFGWHRFRRSPLKETGRKAPLLIVLYLALFILLRDAMTPLGLWSFGTRGFFWIRLHSDPWFLVAFGLVCLGLSLGLYYFDRDNRPLFRWTRGGLPLGL